MCVYFLGHLCSYLYLRLYLLRSYLISAWLVLRPLSVSDFFPLWMRRKMRCQNARRVSGDSSFYSLGWNVWQMDCWVRADGLGQLWWSIVLRNALVENHLLGLCVNERFWGSCQVVWDLARCHLDRSPASRPLDLTFGSYLIAAS